LLDLLHSVLQLDHILSQLLLAGRDLFESLAYGGRILRHCFELRSDGRGRRDRFRSGRFRVWHLHRCRWGHVSSRDIEVGGQAYQGQP
jgi:hypothetical protein